MSATELVGTGFEAGADAEIARLLPEIFDSIADGVTVLDRKGMLRYANASAARMMGYGSASELVGRSSQSVVGRFQLLDDDGRALDPSALPTRRAFAGEADPEATVRFRTMGTQSDRWSLVRARLLTGPDPDAALGITSFQANTASKQVDGFYFAREPE